MAKNAGFRFKSRGREVQTSFRVLAARCARGLQGKFAPRSQRAQGRPGARCTRGLACIKGVEGAHEHTGSAETLRPSPRNGSTDYTCSPRRSGFVCHRRPANMACPRPVGPASPPRDLTPTQRLSGPHDFSVRNNIVRRLAVRSLTELIPPCNHLRARRCRVHRIPPRVSDDPDTPLEWDETGLDMH